MVRTHEISRLEGFSDAVFGFALTLLVVSLEVPRSYAELMALMSGFVSFACCFALLLWLWYEHNTFFRRYGLQDGVTIVLNGCLLFTVLFYVYPLKFMFDSMFARWMPGRHGLVQMELHHLVSVTVGFVSLAIALWAPLSWAPFAPAALGLMGPGHGLWAVRHTRVRRARFERGAGVAVVA